MSHHRPRRSMDRRVGFALRTVFPVAVVAGIGTATADPPKKLTWRSEQRDGGPVLVADDGAVSRRLAGEDLGWHWVTVHAQGDFDGDGMVDAVISGSGGGNCCPSTVLFVTLRDGKIVPTEIAESWLLDIEVTRKDGKALVSFTDPKEARGSWRFEDGRAVVVAAPTRTVLTASVEIRAENRKGNQETMSFLADLDADGAPEKVECRFWERWGSLICELPVADEKGSDVSLGCKRWGVLSSMTNGRHDLVCDDHTTFRFDGKKWLRQPASGGE